MKNDGLNVAYERLGFLDRKCLRNVVAGSFPNFASDWRLVQNVAIIQMYYVFKFILTHCYMSFIMFCYRVSSYLCKLIL